MVRPLWEILLFWMRWELASSPILVIGLELEDCHSLRFTEFIEIHQLKDVEFDILPRLLTNPTHTAPNQPNQTPSKSHS